MKTNKLFQPHSFLAAALAVLAGLFTHCAAPSGFAAAYYWDNNGNTAGFGTAAGTWASTTTGNATQGWSTSATGALVPGNVTTTSADALNFGNGATGLATGTITVSGNVTNNSMTFASGSGAITNSGGTITLGGTTPFIMVNNASDAIGSILAGTAGLVKGGTGTLTLSGANTYTGSTSVTNGVVNISNWGAPTLGAITVAGASTPILGISGGTLALAANSFFVGSGAGKGGTVNQSGGTVSFTSGNALLVGNASPASTYNLSGGTLTSFSSATRGVMLGVNPSSTATFNLSGTGNLALGSGELAVGRNDSATAGCTVAFNQTGGTATVGNLSVGGQSGATSTTATFSLTGGAFSATTFQNLVAAASSSATLTLGGSAQVTLPAFPVRVGTANLTFDFSTGWLASQAASAAYLSGLSAAYLTTNGANFNVGSGKDITVAQSFADAPGMAGTLRKTGVGTLTLSGNNTYTGITTVSNGTLGLNGGVLSGPVVVNDGGALSLPGTGTVPSLLFANTGTMSFNVAAGGILTVTAANGVTNNGAAGSITINITGSAPAEGNYTLIAYSGSLQGSGFSAYKMGVGPVGKAYQLVNAAGVVQLVVSTPLYWTGANGPEWSTNPLTPQNWTLGPGGSPSDYVNGLGVVFDDTATSYTLDVSVADVSPLSVGFNNNGAYTLQGSKAIAGSTALSMSGAGTVTILNANTYTGPTVISAGTVQLGDGTSGHDGTIANSPSVVNSGALVYSRFGSAAYGGVISGSGTVTMNGTGAQTLSGANTYTGATTVSGGELDISNWGATTPGTITVGNVTGTTGTLGIFGGTLGSSVSGIGNFYVGSGSIGIVNQTNGIVYVNIGGGALLLGNGTAGAGTYNLSGGSVAATGASTARGVMIGVNNDCSGTFNLSGTGNLALGLAELAVGRNDAGAANCTVAFNQTGGTATVGYLSVGGQSGSTNTTATFSLTGGALAATNFQNLVAAANSSAMMKLGGSAQVTLPAFPVPAGTVNLTLDFTTGWLAPLATSTAYLNGLTAAYLTANGANFNVASGNDITVAQGFQNAPTQAGALNKTGTGTLTLSGANTYSGNTTISAGELKFSTAGSASTSITVAGGATNGVLVASANGQWVNTGSLTNNNGSIVDINCGAAAPSTTVAPIKVNNLSLGTGLTIRISGGGFVAGQSYPLIIWTGSGPADASGFGTLILPNRVSGNLGVSRSTLYFNVTSTTAPLSWNIGDGTWNTNTPNWLDATLGTATYADGDWVLLDDASGATGNPTIALANTLSPVKVTMRSSSHDYTLSGSGAIAGNGSLTLDAANTRTLTLSGANTYAGGTTISGGTLVANSANALGTGPVINNGTLSLVAGGVTYSGLQTSLTGSGTNNVTLATGSTSTILYGDYSQFTGVWNIGIGNVGGKIAINFPRDNPAVVYNVLSNGTVFCASPATNYSGTAYLYGGTPGENYGQFRLQNSQWSGPIILAGPSSTAAGKGTIGVLTPTVGNYSGPISEMNGSQPLVIAGTGTCILGGVNTFTGPTLFTTASTLVLSNQLALQYSTLNFTTNYADVLQFAPGISSFTLGGLTGNRDMALDDLAYSPVGLTLGGNGQSTAYSGVLSGAGSLTKVGAGTLTLYGNNTYLGSTIISNGTLVAVTGGSCSSSSVTVPNTAATLSISITNNTLPWSCADLAFAAAGTMDFNFGSVSPSATQAPLVVNNAVDFTAAKPSVIARGTSVAALPVGSYPLMTWYGSVSGTVPTSAILPPGVAGNLTVSGSTLYLNITAASAQPLFWAANSGVWDINSTANWKDNNGTTATYQENILGGEAVVFDDLVSGAGPNITVTLSTNVAPASVTFSNSTKHFTLNGTWGITGGAGLTLNGTGTNTLANTNTYTGATTINAGTLQLGAANAVPGSTSAGDVTVNGTLDLNGYSDAINGLNGSGVVDTVAGGTPTLTVGANGHSGSFSGVIQNTAGTLALAKSGAGTQTLSGTNTYSGGTTISAGTLTIGGAGQLGSGSYAANITDNGAFTYASSANQTLSGIISGNGSLATASTNTLTLSGANTYTGPTTLSAGMVVANTLANGGSPSSIGASANVASNLAITAGSTLSYTGPSVATDRRFNLAGGAFWLDVPNAGVNLTFTDVNGSTYNASPNGIALGKTGTGTVTLNTSGTAPSLNWLQVLGGNLTGNLSLTLVRAAQALWMSTNATLSLPTITFTGNGGHLGFDGTTNQIFSALAFNAATRNIDVLAGGLAIISGPISSSGANGFTKTSDGTLTLSGTNTYTGSTTISAGTLQISGAGTLGGGIYAATITDNGVFTYASSANQTLSGIISGSGSLANTGTGILTLSGVNTYTGGTTISGGTLQLGDGTSGHDGTIANTAEVANNGALVFNRFGSSSAGYVISGNGTVTKTGSGKQTLTAANTYTGATIIRAGTLALANDSAINLTSGLSIAAGAALDTVALTVPPPQTIPITASGTGTNIGTTAAAIIGVFGFPHDLGSRPLILNYDGSNPALYLAGGTLNLNNNPFTINGSVLPNGVYTIIAQSDAPAVTGSVTSSTVNGTALTGRIGTVSLSGNTVVLTVSGGSPPQPTIAPVTVSGTNLVVSVATVSGAHYVLQSATNLTPTVYWMNESTNSGTGGNLILSVPIEPGKPERFLRFWVY